MKALLTAWVFTLVATAGGLAYLWNVEVPKAGATEPEQATITATEKAPTLSSGPMTFDASEPKAADEDCPSSC